MEKKLLLEQFNKDFAAMQRGMMMQFDKLPLPVYVLRIEADASGLPQDFIFVYANSACASFLGIDGKNYLLGMSFSDIWGDSDAKWLNIYTKTALEGLTQNVEDYNDNLKNICRSTAISRCTATAVVLCATLPSAGTWNGSCMRKKNVTGSRWNPV